MLSYSLKSALLGRDCGCSCRKCTAEQGNYNTKFLARGPQKEPSDLERTRELTDREEFGENSSVSLFLGASPSCACVDLTPSTPEMLDLNTGIDLQPRRDWPLGGAHGT